MTVSRDEIDAMANLMRILEGKSAVETARPETASAPTPAAAPELGTMEGDKAAMKAVLMALQGVSESVVAPPTPVSPRVDPALREAALTEKTPRGVRIEGWEIVVNEGRIKTYDVVSIDGNTTIAKDLYLYEAALGLVRRLNEGVAINDSRVASLLKLEENFVRNHQNATVFKERARKAEAQGDTRRAAIAEDRQDEAARQAQSDMEEILKLAGLRR